MEALPNYRTSGLFSEVEKLVLEYADAMTLTPVEVSDGLFAKLRDYMIRVDDSVTCKTCGKKFDIPSQHSMVFLQKADTPN